MNRALEMDQPPQLTKSLVALASLWALVMIAALAAVGSYANTPGEQATPPSRWPKESVIWKARDRATLLIMVHPNCPCTRATASEIALLLTRVPPGVVATYVVVADIPGVKGAGVWPSYVPSARIFLDHGNLESRRFAAHTSGQTLLYAADGRLQYNGGVTESRGHEGDNAGLFALQDLLRGRRPERHSGPVYGCTLGSSEEGLVAAR